MKSNYLPISALFALALLACPLSATATTYDFIGSGLSWPGDGVWEVIDGANDPDDGANEEVDFVGDETNPMGYTYRDETYVYFRMRLDVGTIQTSNPRTFSDSHFVLIDVVGQTWTSGAAGGTDEPGGLVAGDPDPPLNENPIDYSFVWDSASNDQDAHGLEMQVRSTTGIAAWSATRMDDIDGNNVNVKGSNDINGDTDTANGGRGWDGYIRGIDGNVTTNFDTTTFLDFAVSWSYLTTYTSLRNDQTWNVTFGSINSSNDHGNIAGDVAGGVNPANDNNTGWSPDPLAPADAPAPTSLWLLTLGFSILAAWRVRGKRQH